VVISATKYPINNEDDHELLGFVAKDTAGWQAQTVFGYPLTRTDDRTKAEHIVREQGLSSLKGAWQYLDEDDHAWHPCVIKDANELQVTVIRTNALGFIEIDDGKLVIIKNPSELNLQKT
jgi:hypothetical protein